MKKYRWGWIIILSLTACFQPQNNALNFRHPQKPHIFIQDMCKPYFDSCGVAGAMVIFDSNNQQWLVTDSIEAQKAYLPASTFKIINLLIALETHTIKGENDTVKWVGTTDTVKYGYRPEIYHDMTVKEAFEVSAGWVFIELAKKIGKVQYQKYLAACDYGNLNFTENNDDFWNFGDFAISPVNQVVFIQKLYKNQLPFSQRNMEIVKKVMVVENENGVTISAKTGWTRDKGINTGWWVGCVQTQDNAYYFATRLLQDRKFHRDNFGSCRKEITKKTFRQLGFLASEQTQK